MIFVLNGRGAAPWLIILFFASSFFVSLLSMEDGEIKEATLLHRYSTISQNKIKSDSISSKIFQSFKKKEKHEFSAPWLRNNQSWKTIFTKTSNTSIIVSVIYFNSKSTIEQYEIKTKPFIKGTNLQDIWLFKKKIEINGRIDFVQTSNNEKCLNVIYHQQKNQKIKRFAKIICENENIKLKFPGDSEIASFEQSQENLNCFYYSRVFDQYKFRYICKNDIKKEGNSTIESFNGPISTDDSSYLISLQQQEKEFVMK